MHFCCVYSISISLLTVAPEITVNPVKGTAAEGGDEQDFTLTVTNAVTAYPPVTKDGIVWKLKDSVISASDGYQLTTSKNKLSIPAKEMFAGLYSVEVSNAAGHDSAMFTLSVLGNSCSNSVVYTLSLLCVCSSC